MLINSACGWLLNVQELAERQWENYFLEAKDF